MTTLVLIRHGQSVANRDRIFIGQQDYPLSELGVLQAEKTAAYVAENYPVDRIYASDLSRAYCTGKALADKLSMEITVEKRLREIYIGDWEGRKIDQLRESGDEMHRIWRTDIGRSQCPNGENPRDVLDRAAKAVEYIVKENEGKTVVLATHAMVVRVLQCYYENRPIEELQEVPWVTNASVTVLTDDHGKRGVVKAGYDEHLGEIRTMILKRM